MADHPSFPFDSLESAIQAIRQGQMVIVTDDEARENEGDFIMAASKVTPEAINQMLIHGRGLICVPTTSHQLGRLGLSPMVQRNHDAHETDFTVSVDAAEGITTGISAYDRTTTIKVLANPESNSDQLIQPGHIFPLRAKPGGVLERAGHTEAAVDLASLAGLHPSGIICEILDEEGRCARLPDLIKLKNRLGLKMVSIADLITYRYKRDRFIELLSQQPFDCAFGHFTLHIFRNIIDGRHHIAFSLGELSPSPTLVRVQKENLLGDIFRAKGTHGYDAINKSLEKIQKEGKGVLLYINCANGGIPETAKKMAGKNKARDFADTTTMDFRDYGVGAQILVEMGLRQIRLLSSVNRRRVIALDGYGLEITEELTLE